MKKIFVIFAFLVTVFNAFADVMSANDVVLVDNKQSMLDISLSNTSTGIVGLQFNLTLPEGITPAMDGDMVSIEPSSRLRGSYSLRGKRVADGSYLFTFLSNDRTPIDGKSGKLFSIALQNTALLPIGSYEANISGVTISDINGNEQSLADTRISISVIHSYKLTYKVDGNVYKEYTLNYGTAITPEPEPTKEGYTFSGWSEIPATMPAHDVEVNGSFVKTEEPGNPGSDIEPDTDISAFDNVIYIQNQEVRADGQFVIPVRMNNTAAITAFQFTLTLPEGITIARNDKGKNLIALDEDCKADSHTISSNVLPDGSVTVACLSLESEPFYGNDGVVVNITVDIPADMADGDYAVILKNIEMTSPNNAKYNVDRVKSTMSVISVLPGDVNGDGSITISDAVGIVNFVIMTNTAGLNEKAADANGDGSVSITDAVFVVNEVIHSGFAPARRLPGNGQPLRAE